MKIIAFFRSQKKMQKWCVKSVVFPLWWQIATQFWMQIRPILIGSQMQNLSGFHYKEVMCNFFFALWILDPQQKKSTLVFMQIPMWDPRQNPLQIYISFTVSGKMGDKPYSKETVTNSHYCTQTSICYIKASFFKHLMASIIHQSHKKI